MLEALEVGSKFQLIVLDNCCNEETIEAVYAGEHKHWVNDFESIMVPMFELTAGCIAGGIVKIVAATPLEYIPT